MWKSVMKLLRKNILTALIFETAYIFIIKRVLIPAFNQVFLWTIDWCADGFLCNENTAKYGRNPILWVTILVIVFLTSIVVLFEICGLIQIYHASKSGQSISIFTLCRISARMTGRFFFGKNLLILPFLLLVLPFAFTILNTHTLTQIAIPELVMDAIVSKKIFLFLYLLYVIAATVTAYLGGLSLHFFFLDGMEFPAAFQKSVKVMLSSHFRYLIPMILLQVVVVVFEELPYSIANWLVSYYSSRTDLSSEYGSAVAVGIEGLASFLNNISVTIVTVCSMALTSYMYYRLKEKSQEAVTYIMRLKTPTILYQRVRIVLVSVVCLLVMISVSDNFWAGNKNKAADGLSTRIPNVEITAHRGDSIDAPENTLPAFEEARLRGAAWLEMDVQELADGTLVVYHDKNIERLTGVNTYIWDLSWEEFSKMDIGAYLNPEAWSGIYPITFEDYLNFCVKHDDFLLNIEIKKYHQTSENFVSRIVDEVKRRNLQDRTVFTSLTSSCVKEVKQIDPELKTAYVMYFAYGNFKNLPFADYFSVDESILTQNSIRQIHRLGKKVWAWTIRDPEDVSKLIYMGVDNIITDDIAMVQNEIHMQYNNIGSVRAVLTQNQHAESFRRLGLAVFKNIRNGIISWMKIGRQEVEDAMP